jgi:hypothetical protein
MQARVAAGKDAVFDLCIRLATPECIPVPGAGDPSKEVMAAEYCDPAMGRGSLAVREGRHADLPGDPTGRSEQRVPAVAAPVQRLEHVAFDGSPRADLSREKARHKAHAEVRLKHLYGTAPGAMVGKAPF